MHKHIPGQPISIGKPTPNNNVYILDKDENPVPIGKPGVMWAGGKGVARGYIGLPEESAAKWRHDKFLNDG
jgi:non-ribosomal peptide synthetase component F